MFLTLVAVRALPEAKRKLTLLQVTKQQRLDPVLPVTWLVFGEFICDRGKHEFIHSEDNVKKVAGIKVPEDSGLEEKSLLPARKWDVAELVPQATPLQKPTLKEQNRAHRKTAKVFT